MIEKVKCFFINLIRSVKEKMNPVTAAIVILAVVLVTGTVIVCATRHKEKRQRQLTTCPYRS